MIWVLIYPTSLPSLQRLYLCSSITHDSNKNYWQNTKILLEIYPHSTISIIVLICSYFTETFYWFGDNNHTEWKDLFDIYKQPQYRLPRMEGMYSFGLAGKS